MQAHTELRAIGIFRLTRTISREIEKGWAAHSMPGYLDLYVHIGRFPQFFNVTHKKQRFINKEIFLIYDEFSGYKIFQSMKKKINIT